MPTRDAISTDDVRARQERAVTAELGLRPGPTPRALTSGTLVGT